jgi:hypothetical protein
MPLVAEAVEVVAPWGAWIGPTWLLPGQPPFVSTISSQTTNNFRFSTSLHYCF